jgi:alkanesulfonate monooxygenase SsuD/methylene tetrahydromethanopterin reductase-like flavin-dependent oxidoreductase (luciferase family)
MTETGRRGFHLALQFPPGHLDVESCVQLARTAERGLFDFVLLADTSNPMPVLAALAAVTEKVGLVGAVDTAARQPFEVARQLATLDHLCAGRAGWAVTDTDHGRAAEFVTVAEALWVSWAADAVVADAEAGVYAQPDRIRAVEHRGEWFDVRGVATLPAGPQGSPLLVHAADTAAGLDFGARFADVVITSQHAEVRARAAACGRDPDDVLVFASVALSAGAGADVDRLVRSDALDGVILVPSPGRLGREELDEFVQRC